MLAVRLPFTKLPLIQFTTHTVTAQLHKRTPNIAAPSRRLMPQVAGALKFFSKWARLVHDAVSVAVASLEFRPWKFQTSFSIVWLTCCLMAVLLTRQHLTIRVCNYRTWSKYTIHSVNFTFLVRILITAFFKQTFELIISNLKKS